MKVLVTGANGFIGRPLCKYLTAQQYDVVPVVRRPSNIPNEYILKINDDTSLNNAVDGCENIIHLAGRAHIMKEYEDDPQKAFHKSNVEFTYKLAKKAAEAGARRFIFMSTIKVNGELTTPGTSFSPNDTPNPEDNDYYALTKWEAELKLQEISKETGLEFVIIRPPIVYGPGVKGNFLSLLNLIERGLPLPFGTIHNQRSLVGINNLINLIGTCLTHPAAADQIFLVCDSKDLSTTSLIQHLSRALNKPSRLFPLPPIFLRLALNILGKKNIAQRLLENLQINNHKTKELLNWSPPISVDEELRRTVKWYLELQ